MQIESNTDEYTGGIDTEKSPSIASDIDESMDVDMLPASAEIEPNADECTGGIDIEKSLPIESIIDESIGTKMSTETEDGPEFDLGKWVGKSSKLSDAKKSEILRQYWVPPENYNFRDDSDDPKRCFIYKWLKEYAPWLAYSKKLKGGLCLYCVLFPPIIAQGVLGAFIVKPFTKYKDLNESCRNHATSQWHRASTISANSFMKDVPVNVQLVSGHQKMIEENKKILSKIISTIIFCGTHDLALRGKKKYGGNCFHSHFLFKQKKMLNE